MSPLAATDYAIVQPSPSFSEVETMLDGQNSTAAGSSSSSSMNNTNSSASPAINPNSDVPVGATTANTLDDTAAHPSSSSTSSTSNTSRKRQAALKRIVSFNEVEVREYARCLGNNPATTHGPPLTIDWKYERKSSLPLDLYEKDRPSKDRRSISALQVPSTVREAMLRQHTDCTKQDIARVVQQTRKARHERQLTVAMQSYESWHLIFESLQRKWARWTNRRPSKKREMEILWEQAQSHNPRVQDDDLGTASSSSNCSMNNNKSGEEKTLMTSPSLLSQQGEEVLLQDKDKDNVDSTTDDDEDEEQHAHGGQILGYSGNASAMTDQSNKSFVVVGEDGTTIVDDRSAAGGPPVHSSADAGQVIVMQKSPRRKKGLFGRSAASNGNSDINTVENRTVTTTGDIVEC